MIILDSFIRASKKYYPQKLLNDKKENRIYKDLQSSSSDEFDRELDSETDNNESNNESNNYKLKTD